jgi:hypothetical protein
MSKHYHSQFPSSPSKKRRVETTSTDKDTLTTLKSQIKNKKDEKNVAYHKYIKIADELKTLKTELQDMCPHKDYEREPTYDYHGPSFYYRCKACDKYK